MASVLTNFRRGSLSASANNGSTGLDTVSTLNSITSDNSATYSLDAMGNQAAANSKNQLTGSDFAYDQRPKGDRSNFSKNVIKRPIMDQSRFVRPTTGTWCSGREDLTGQVQY
jgi:hypothetical protein